MIQLYKIIYFIEVSCRKSRNFSRLSGLKSAQNDGKAQDYHHSDNGFYMARDEMTAGFRSRNSEM